MVCVADYYEALVVRRDRWYNCNNLINNYYNPWADTLAHPGDQAVTTAKHWAATWVGIAFLTDVPAAKYILKLCGEER